MNKGKNAIEKNFVVAN